MKYSGHINLLCEFSRLLKCNAFNILGYNDRTFLRYVLLAGNPNLRSLSDFSSLLKLQKKQYLPAYYLLKKSFKGSAVNRLGKLKITPNAPLSLTVVFLFNTSWWASLQNFTGKAFEIQTWSVLNFSCPSGLTSVGSKVSLELCKYIIWIICLNSCFMFSFRKYIFSAFSQLWSLEKNSH